MKKKNISEEKILKIKLDGDLSIQRAEEIKKILMEPQEDFSGIELNVSDAVSVDLSFLQLLFAAEKKYGRDEKSFIVETEGKSLLADEIYKAGLENQLNKIFYSEK